MDRNNDERLLNALIYKGEEDFWFRDYRLEDFRTINKTTYESFLVFDKWRKREKTFLSRWYPKMERIYYKYFLSDISVHWSFKELKKEKDHLLPGYKIHTPVGFREEFDGFLKRYGLKENRELLLVFLTQVKLYYERNLHSYESKDYFKIHKEYREELVSLKDLRTKIYDIQDITINVKRESPYKFSNQLTIRKHLIEALKVVNTDFAISESRNNEIFNYDTPKRFATSTLAKAVARPLNKFLQGETNLVSDPDQIECIAEIIDFTQIPIHDMHNRIIEIKDVNGSISNSGEIKTKIRNWLK